MSSSTDDRPGPWNIMVDPRVYRGSVIAKKRAEISKINQEIKKIQNEERYRAEVIRNRLNLTLHKESSTALPDIKRYSTHRYSRLAGPVGRRIRLNYSSVSAGERVRRVGDVPRLTPRKSPRVRGRSQLPNIRFSSVPLHDPHWIPSGIAQPSKSKRVEKSTRIKFSGNGIHTTVDFRQVRFVMAGSGSQKTLGMAPHESTPRRKLRSPPPPPRRRRSSISVPPPSRKGTPTFAEAHVQTEEPFDDIIAPIIKEIAETSIAAAMRNLEEEDIIQQKEKEREEIFAILTKQIQKNEELSLKIEEEERKNEEIRQERDKVISELQAEEGKVLASSLVTEVIDSSLHKILENHLLEDLPKYRSVGADTRSLEEERLHRELIHAELEKDFFPWMYTRAEKLQQMQQAKMHLKEIIFGHNDKEKLKSKAELKAQIKRLK